MRLAILADTHGNLPAQEAVLEDVERMHVDGMVIAGDYVGCPHAIECLQLLRQQNAWMIRGNSDTSELIHAAGKAPPEEYTNHQFALGRWVHAHLDADSLAFLSNLPEQLVIDLPGLPSIRVVHGSPSSPLSKLYDNGEMALLTEALAQTDESVLVCGHTHMQWNLWLNGKLALNPGSTACPLDGRVGAQYSLLTAEDGRWQVQHRHMTYDLGRIRRDFTYSGLLEQGGALARAFLLSIETAQNVSLDFLNLGFALAASMGYDKVEFIPDEVWERAEAVFPWSDWTT